MKQEIIETSKVIYNNNLYEQVYNPKNKTSHYVGWDALKQEPILLNDIEDGNRKYIPIKDDLIDKGAVLLPTGVMEYGSFEDLTLEIKAFLQTWLDISVEHEQKVAWYIPLSWVTENLHTIPCLRALGDYGTGKTRYLDVVGGLCYKPMFVGGSVRPAPIYRVIDLWRGTAIFDEFTLKLSDESQDIIQILNNGFQRGKPVLRCEQNNVDKVRAFDPFGGKIIASREKFKDRALESRCITEIMQQTDRDDIPCDLTKEFFEIRTELQNKLLMYRFQNWNSIDPSVSISIDFGNILPRIKQALTPFTVLFAHDHEQLTDFIRYAQQYNNQIAEENAESFDGQIFNHYLKLLNEHEEYQQTLDDYEEPTITSTSIKDSMVLDGWKEEKLNTRTIGRHLKTLGFTTTPKKISGKTIKVVEIDGATLSRLKKRYSVTLVTKVTSVTKSTLETTGVKNLEEKTDPLNVTQRNQRNQRNHDSIIAFFCNKCETQWIGYDIGFNAANCRCPECNSADTWNFFIKLKEENE